MSIDDGMKIKQVLEAVKTSIATAFPILQTVDYNNIQLDAERKLPAFFFDIPRMPPIDNDRGTGQLWVMLQFEGYLVFDDKQEGVQSKAKGLALAIAHHLRLQRFGLDVKPATVTNIEKDDLNPDYDSYHMILIEFNSECPIGERNDLDDPFNTVYVQGNGSGYDQYLPTV
jgi:hypothetical protein